jgi:peptidyl-prolyl cis-trans isomerase D
MPTKSTRKSLHISRFSGIFINIKKVISRLDQEKRSCSEMAVLNDIREKSPKFIIAGAALIFIVLIIFDWGLDISGRKGRGTSVEVLGKVNGKEVNYKQFNEMLRRASENYKRQQGSEVDEETERQLRSQVWNQVVEEMLIEQEIERLGIKVTDQEILDIVNGQNPPEFLVKQFTDSTGTFRRDAYQQAMKDPQNQQVWVQVEEMLRQQQKQIKLQRVLLATINVSDGELRQRFIDRNETMNAEFVLFDINRLVPDSAAAVTDDDIRKQYDAHAADYQAKAGRKVKYVFFNQNASSADSAAVEKDILNYLDQAKSGAMDFSELAKMYTEIPSSEAFFKHGELSKQKEDAVFSAKKNEIVGPIRDYDGIHLIKIIDQRQGGTEFVKASHILINSVPGPDSVKTIQKVHQLLAQARSGANFAQLARENSQDYGSAVQGGELGWASKDKWVKPFADAAFKAGVGSIVGPVRTQFGWHIIKVTGRDRREVKIIDLALKVKASSQTVDAAFQQAQDFGSLAKDEGFEKAAQNSKFEVMETPEFAKTGSIPGLGNNDAIINFAFNNKLGAISEPIYMRGGVIVIKISNIRDEGVRPLEEVKNAVRALAVKEKKLEKIHSDVDAFYKTLTPSSDLITAAQTNPNLTAQATGPFKPTDAPNGVGRDLKFIGTALALKSGELSKPVEGNRGYYIIKLLSKTEFDTAAFNVDRESLRTQLLQEKRQRALTDWMTSLRDKADIVDHRDKFFR